MIDLVQDLYDRLCLFIIDRKNKHNTPSIFTNLKNEIEEIETYWKGYQKKRESIRNYDDRKKQSNSSEQIINSKFG